MPDIFFLGGARATALATAVMYFLRFGIVLLVWGGTQSFFRRFHSSQMFIFLFSPDIALTDCV